MKPFEKDTLLREILSDDSLCEFRRASLDRAITGMRRARQRRRNLQIAIVVSMPLVVLALFLFKTFPDGDHPFVRQERSRVDQAASANVRPAAPGDQSQVEVISDEELFALFPNRALALIGPPGRQELVFLDRPETKRSHL